MSDFFNAWHMYIALSPWNNKKRIHAVKIFEIQALIHTHTHTHTHVYYLKEENTS